MSNSPETAADSPVIECQDQPIPVECYDSDANQAEAVEPEHYASHNQEFGRRGERAAARFLERRGYQILERNWTCPAGEADIIALDGDTVVFVEVKTRSNTIMGFPAEAVDEAKRSRYEKIAAFYLAETTFVDVPVRFDVVGLLVIGAERALVKHHLNAFGVA